MRRSTAQAAAPGHSPLLSIGQVLARLSPEFSDLTPSKLRFLEEQGLVSPSRTTSGYRKFSPSDVERLRMVLGMQRDHYLPLKVIKAYLDDVDAGVEPTLPGGSRSPSSLLSTARRLSRDELAAEAGATPTLVSDAIATGFLQPAEYYGDDAVTVLKALVELGRSGIDPRHLRSVRTAAEREIALVETAVAPLLRRRDASGTARATEVAIDISAHIATVHASLMRSAIGRLDR